METYIPSTKVFEKLLNQSGGSIDRYIYNQSGAGLGNFFAKLFRTAKPLLSSAINTFRPELESIGTKLVDSGAKVATSKIENLRRKGATFYVVCQKKRSL